MAMNHRKAAHCCSSGMSNGENGYRSEFLKPLSKEANRNTTCRQKVIVLDLMKRMHDSSY